MVRICQLVEGMPLALELAASWVKTLNCAEIAAICAMLMCLLGYLMPAVRHGEENLPDHDAIPAAPTWGYPQAVSDTRNRLIIHGAVTGDFPVTQADTVGIPYSKGVDKLRSRRYTIRHSQG